MTDRFITLRGAGGEPVDLARTFMSHGVAELPPLQLDEAAGRLTMTLATPRGGARTVEVTGTRAGRRARVRIAGSAPSRVAADALVAQVRHVLRLDEDLSPLYEMVAGDPGLAWIGTGAGRMIRSATVYEEVVKTICTTNCSWSSTERMVGAMVEHLGAKAPGAPAAGTTGRAFPSPAAMAEAGVAFYRDTARAGYRAEYFASLARSVASGDLDLEPLGTASPDELPDDELEAQLLALPGVGPYAAAHVMTMLGRYSRLILDSWTRPTYARLVGKKQVADRTIVRRFARYGRYAGLAFWMFITRDWIAQPGEPVG